MKTYMWVATQIVGNPENWSHSYTNHGQQLTTRAAANRAGWKALDHDDFNIATIEDGKVIAFGWGMDDFSSEDCDDLDEITAAVLP